MDRHNWHGAENVGFKSAEEERIASGAAEARRPLGTEPATNGEWAPLDVDSMEERARLVGFSADAAVTRSRERAAFRRPGRLFQLARGLVRLGRTAVELRQRERIPGVNTATGGYPTIALIAANGRAGETTTGLLDGRIFAGWTGEKRAEPRIGVVAEGS